MFTNRLFETKLIKLIALIFLSELIYSECLILKGEKTSDKDWVLLGKFCFISDESRFDFDVSYPETYKIQKLLFYYDDQWQYVYPKPEKSCSTKVYELISYQITALNITTNTNSNETLRCGLETSGSVNRIRCNDKRWFKSARPRWWFFVVSRCDPYDASVKGIKISYSIELTNGNDSFRRHFSADEFGILETSIAFFFVYLILSILVLIAAKLLYNKLMLHITFKLFMFSVWIQFLSFIFMMIEYVQFSNSGIPTPGMLTISHVWDAIAQIIFLLMLILVAKGYTITRGRLRKITVIKLVIFFSVYLIAYIITFVYAEALFDDGIVNYYYNSPGGVSTIVIKLLLGFIWFIYSIIFTIKNYPEKRKFYIIFLVFFGLWFWASPVIILLCNYLIADWVRQFVAFVIQSSIVSLGHGYFFILTRPTKGNETFPYHIKTNQINLADDAENPNDNFPHHEESDGGNKSFDNLSKSLTISNIFSLPSFGDKYQVKKETNEIMF